MTRSVVTSMALTGLILAACARNEAPAPVTATAGVPDEVVANFVAAMDQFNPGAVRELMMSNAKIMPPNVAAISGIDGIIEYYQGTLADELDFEFTREASAESGGLAAAEGTYRVKNVTTGEYIEQGKWMAVFAQVDGKWKVARLMTNTDAPVAAPVVGVEEAVAGEATQP